MADNTTSIKKSRLYFWLMVIALLVLIIETARDTQRNGDFIGYLNAGNLVLQGQNIYSDHLNTWPPFFSVASVPLALFDHFSPFLVRLVWLLGSWTVLFTTMRMALLLFLHKKLLLPFQKEKSKNEMAFNHPVILVPFLLTLRFLMDNSSFLQINLYILALTFGSVYFYYQKKFILAALLLAFSISIKVFPVFVLLYFLYKRAFKISIYTLIFMVLFCATTIPVFGWETALQYHQTWFLKSVIPLPTTSQMNQSLMAAFGRLFSDGATGVGFQINIVNWSAALIKKLYYSVVILAAVYPLYAFRKKLNPDSISLGQALQWAILFNLLPLLSPVAWKPYFVILWIPFFICNYLLFSKNIVRDSKPKSVAKILFYASLPCLIFSSELFSGVHFSDVLEVCNIIAIGALLLTGSLGLLYLAADKQNLQKPLFSLQNTAHE